MIVISIIEDIYLYNPLSSIGRFLTVILTGMILVGIFTATLTSILVGSGLILKEEINNKYN